MNAETQKKMISFELEKIENSIYIESINARVAKKVDDPDMEKRAIEALIKLEKYKDAYTDELINAG